LKGEQTTLIEPAGAEQRRLLSVSRIARKDGPAGLVPFVLDPGMAFARNPNCGDAATTESSHSRIYRALNR
jgi:hypothetical protein